MSALDLLPNVSDPDGWGPTVASEDQEALLPFSLFNKFDRIGKPADFVSAPQASDKDGRKDKYGSFGTSPNVFAYSQQEDEMSFSLVDTRPKPKSKFGIQRIGGSRGRGGFRGRGGRGGAWGSGPGRWGPDQRSGTAPVQGGASSSSAAAQAQAKKKPAKSRWDNTRTRRYVREWDRTPRVNQPSIVIQEEWTEVASLTIQQLEAATLPFLEKTAHGRKLRGRTDDTSEDEDSKALRESQSVQTLYEAGTVYSYDKAFDRVTARTSVRLRTGQPPRFIGVHPGQDPVMKRLQEDKAGNIYATDTVLSLLMASAQSVFSWDIVVRKNDNGIFLDRRPSSLIGFQTVNETGQDLTLDEPLPESVNHPTQLMHEATNIQQQFVLQVLRDKVEVTLPDTRPVPAGQLPPASYRYRRFELGEGKRVIARSEIQAAMEKGSESQPLFLSIRSLLEFDARSGAAVADWRQKLDAQRGYIIATEFRNNACKLSRWIAQAMLSGIDEIRLGFISRVSPTDAKQHQVLGVQRFKPTEFAHQVGVKSSSLWGSLNLILETLQSFENGAYLIFRDPNEPIVRFYSLPKDIVLP